MLFLLRMYKISVNLLAIMYILSILRYLAYLLRYKLLSIICAPVHPSPPVAPVVFFPARNPERVLYIFHIFWPFRLINYSPIVSHSRMCCEKYFTGQSKRAVVPHKSSIIERECIFSRSTTFRLGCCSIPGTGELFSRTGGCDLLSLPVFNFSLLLWPVWLSFDWSMDAVAPISDWSDPRNAITLSFYVIMGYATVQMIKNRLLMQALALATIPFIPASNLFFYVGFVVAERVLYLPSIGFCLLLGNINSLIPSVSNVIRH